MAYRTDSVKRPRGGRSCVAGGPNLVSCTNTQHIEVISFHRFPNEEKDPQRRGKWINFVRKHRPKFKPSAISSLCLAHFDDSCYNMNLATAKSLGMRRVLHEDAVPTVDVAGQQKENNGRSVGICAASEMRAHCAHAGHDNFNNIICDIYCRSLIVLIFTYFFLRGCLYGGEPARVPGLARLHINTP